MAFEHRHLDISKSARVRISVGEKSYQAVIHNMTLAENLIDDALRAVIIETCEEYYRKVFDVISLSPHGDVVFPHSPPGGHYHILKTVYNHPFARSGGKIKAHDHKPLWGVHVVTGKLRAALSWTYIVTGNIHRGLIGWIGNQEDYFQFVIGEFGTDKMLPRPVLRLVWEHESLIEFIRERIVRYVNKEMPPDWKKRSTYEAMHNVRSIQRTLRA